MRDFHTHPSVQLHADPSPQSQSDMDQTGDVNFHILHTLPVVQPLIETVDREP
jgi:hypothetical protein